MTRRQCNKCPWKKSTDPRTIPNGYCTKKHARLRSTIAREEAPPFCAELRMMACHETPVGRELPCVGWLANQLGEGNNLALRLAVVRGLVDADVLLVGEQHERFEDTLPQEAP